MLKQRLITAIVLLIVFVAALLAPRAEFFGALTLVFVAIGGWEWSRLNGIPGAGAYVLALLVALLCAALWFGGWITYLNGWVWIGVAVVWVVGAPIVLRGGASTWLAIPKTVRWVLGIFVLCMAWAAIWKAKLIGNNFLLSALVLVWVADSGAYFSGKAFGKHKLAPSISPGKSWEGAIGGLLAVMLVAALWIYFDRWYLAAYPMTGAGSLYTMLLQNWSWWGLLIAVIFLTVMSVVGDLTESLMKRSVGIKDSSQILPGHGGILDRTDALLPVLPLSMALVQFSALI